MGRNPAGPTRTVAQVERWARAPGSPILVYAGRIQAPALTWGRDEMHTGLTIAVAQARTRVAGGAGSFGTAGASAVAYQVVSHPE